MSRFVSTSITSRAQFVELRGVDALAAEGFWAGEADHHVLFGMRIWCVNRTRRAVDDAEAFFNG